MSATLIVRHTVADYAAWRVVYDEVDAVRSSHGCTAERVLQIAARATPTTSSPSTSSRRSSRPAKFAEDPQLKEAMGRGGVTGRRGRDLRECLTLPLVHHDSAGVVATAPA